MEENFVSGVIVEYLLDSQATFLLLSFRVVNMTDFFLGYSFS